MTDVLLMLAKNEFVPARDDSGNLVSNEYLGDRPYEHARVILFQPSTV